MIETIFIAGTAAVLAYMIGFVFGYGSGTTATEKRWSEAVAKAEWADRYPTGVHLGVHGMHYDTEADARRHGAA